MLVLLPVLVVGGCKRSPAPAPDAAGSGTAASSAALPSPEQASRCRRLAGFGLTLDASASPSATAKSAEPAADEDDDALLPFGVDLGTAVATPSGFAVAGIRGAGQAFVALLGNESSRRVELGQLHGDTEPPVIAATGERVLVALRTTDAAGFSIRLGQIAGGDVEWGHELSKLGRGVSSLDLATSGAQALLTFQRDEKGSSRVWLGVLASADLKQPFEPKPLDAKNVELPRLTPRPGGYWLSWVRSLPEPKKAGKAAPAVDAGVPEDPEERDLLELGLRVVEVTKLDEQGQPQGTALRVGEPRRQVILFDAAPLASGGLLLAMRSDGATPGAEGGALLLSEVAPDGTVHEDRLDNDDIGVGAPVLLVDASAKLPEPWLSVTSPTDEARIGVVRGAQTQLLADPQLQRSEVVALGAGHFLTARPRGRSVELAALDCALRAAKTPENK